jgi:hypothetical protein
MSNISTNTFELVWLNDTFHRLNKADTSGLTSEVVDITDCGRQAKLDSGVITDITYTQ